MKSTVSSVRILLALGWGLVCVLTVAAPLLLARGEPGALPLYWGFSFFCHQLPGRSFTLAGLPLAACHRCVGIYLGLFAGIVAPVPGFSGSPRARRRWLLAALLPVLIDTALARAGLWSGAHWSRTGSGVFLGYMISTLLMRALAESAARRPLEGECP
ncbi:MAG: DUF2085 domain-containing protein [Acidobacteriota bacterium]|jgi:uncharacterized membrane protein|nr:DUF2085 domain-containing protein [Acidobacteriota bacterium]NLT31979.1 DUF2085 domain-containing protein [Acidobacteriota bacterium]